MTYYRDCYDVLLPPGGKDHPENIWISYVPLERVQADIRELACVEEHRVLLAPRAGWECLKVDAEAPPVRLPYGWLLLYHGVAPVAGSEPPPTGAPAIGSTCSTARRMMWWRPAVSPFPRTCAPAP